MRLEYVLTSAVAVSASLSISALRLPDLTSLPKLPLIPLPNPLGIVGLWRKRRHGGTAATGGKKHKPLPMPKAIAKLPPPDQLIFTEVENFFIPDCAVCDSSNTPI
jgi:hypothetical protein